ncbi:ATP-binding cassette domain-containing protein [Candidatus Shapirobacteria bacterium]|nr:ATP-binding cassette domain-containing protein [Candidatus Shapirobacteria bacterium]
MIEFVKVTKKFGPVVALDDLSFKIEKGEFVFLTGPSGAGKTTLANLLLGKFLPTSGKIFLGQEEIPRSLAKIHLLRRKLGVIFQDFKLISDRTVFENIALPLEIMGRKKAEIKDRVGEVLRQVNLGERINFFPAQLAGGELQRVSLARALVAKPEVLLADEPTGNLDPESAWQLIKLLKEINKLGTLVLMTTHNIDIVNSLCERVIKLEKGRLVKDEKKGKY